MLRSIMTAALILSLSLTAAGCGANNNASTAAHRWNDGVNNAQTQQNLARGGPLDGRNTDGTYYADGNGRVNGYRANSADGSRTSLGNGLTNAGEDLARGAGAAARGVGDAVEDALDGMTGTTNNNNRNNTTRNNTNTAANSGINAGNSVNPPVNNTNRTTNNGTTAK